MSKHRIMSIRGIARLAGISPSAVSLALQGSPKISKTTIKRVKKIARRTGYSPNARIAELMSRLRLSQNPEQQACLGVISFYGELRPWERSLHLKGIYEGMVKRATELGYRIEPLDLQASGMTYKRMRTILDTRGIEGLLCFGSAVFDEVFPAELDHYAIVTQGLSIKTPMHRVINNAYKDTWATLERIYALGYRRPGLVIGNYEEERSGHACVSAYLGWCEHRFRGCTVMPVLRLHEVEEAHLERWLAQHRPDVLVLAHRYEMLLDFRETLEKLHIRIPDEIGVAVISQILKGTEFSGMEENQALMGAWAVELVAARIINRDFGIPVCPRVEMVESRWVQGGSLARRKQR